MIEVLKVAAFIICYFIYMAVICFPIVIALLTDDNRWMWGLILSLPLGIAVVVVGMECWGWADLFQFSC